MSYVIITHYEGVIQVNIDQLLRLLSPSCTIEVLADQGDGPQMLLLSRDEIEWGTIVNDDDPAENRRGPMRVEIRADGQAPYGDGELLGCGTATTEAGVLRIANRERRRHRTTVRVYVDGRRQSIGCDGRGWWARITDIVCDA